MFFLWGGWIRRVLRSRDSERIDLVDVRDGAQTLQILKENIL